MPTPPPFNPMPQAPPAPPQFGQQPPQFGQNQFGQQPPQFGQNQFGQQPQQFGIQNQFGGPAVPFYGVRATTSGYWKFRLIFGLVLALIIGGATWYEVNKTTDAVNRATHFTVPSFPDITFPSTPDVTFPSDISAPEISVPNLGTIPVVVPVDVPVNSAPGSTFGPASTLAPATTIAAPPATALPGGAASFFEGTAAHSVADQFEAALPGDPTGFVQVLIYPDYVVAEAQDPANPAAATGGLWRDGQISPADVTTDGGDLTSQVFHEGDLNWDVIAGLAAQAPGLLNVPGNAVTHIIVYKSPFVDGNPLTINVYVDGAGYVTADGSGVVLSTH